MPPWSDRQPQGDSDALVWIHLHTQPLRSQVANMLCGYSIWGGGGGGGFDIIMREAMPKGFTRVAGAWSWCELHVRLGERSRTAGAGQPPIHSRVHTGTMAAMPRIGRAASPEGRGVHEASCGLRAVRSL